MLASNNHQLLGKMLSATVLHPQGMVLAAKIMVPKCKTISSQSLCFQIFQHQSEQTIRWIEQNLICLLVTHMHPVLSLQTILATASVHTSMLCHLEQRCEMGA